MSSFELCSLDIFRQITQHLTLTEFVLLSGTSTKIRQKCIQDLNIDPEDVTISDFGMKVLDLSTCRKCEYISWIVFYGRCSHPEKCSDCRRRDVNSQFISVLNSYNDKWRSICRYGCNLICNVCEKRQRNGVYCGTIEGWIICNTCYRTFFPHVSDSDISHKPLVKWRFNNGKEISRHSHDDDYRFYESLQILDKFGTELIKCDSCSMLKNYQVRSFYDIYQCDDCVKLNTKETEPTYSFKKTKSPEFTRLLENARLNFKLGLYYKRYGI